MSNNKNRKVSVEIMKTAKFTTSISILNKWAQTLHTILKCFNETLQPKRMHLDAFFPDSKSSILLQSENANHFSSKLSRQIKQNGRATISQLKRSHEHRYAIVIHTAVIRV